jgi:hypothetical protein
VDVVVACGQLARADDDDGGGVDVGLQVVGPAKEVDA